MTAADRPRLLIISFSRLVSDARVLKQIVRFRDHYAVTTLGYGPAPEGVVDHREVPEELPLWRWPRIPLIARQYRRAYWGNPAIAEARRLLQGVQVDLVLANDVEAAGLARQVVGPQRIHADLHEYAPRQKEDLPRWRIFVAPFVRWQLRRFVVGVASTSTVGTRIAREYRARFGLDPIVVTNAAPYRDLTPSEATATGRIRIVHSGAALADRGIDAIIDGVEDTIADVSLDLYLTPNDPAYLERIRARVADSTRITLHPPVAYDQLHETLNRFDVGVHLLPPVNFNNANALPNKFFDYVQARLGIIVGPSPEMSWIVNERGLGAVCGGFDGDALRRVLDGIDVDQVRQWKLAADRSAQALSSDTQVEEWALALAAISGSAPR